MWRVFLGARSITTEVDTIDEVRDYVETNYGPVFQKKMEATGNSQKYSIWDNSNILLNGKNISLMGSPLLKDGDKIDFLSKVAGG
jgi:molybdopterin converting factor small subunit